MRETEAFDADDDDKKSLAIIAIEEKRFLKTRFLRFLPSYS